MRAEHYLTAAVCEFVALVVRVIPTKHDADVQRYCRGTTCNARGISLTLNHVNRAVLDVHKDRYTAFFSGGQMADHCRRATAVCRLGAMQTIYISFDVVQLNALRACV